MDYFLHYKQQINGTPLKLWVDLVFYQQGFIFISLQQ